MSVQLVPAFTHQGKQVLKHGQHFCDCVSEKAAMEVVAGCLMNADLILLGRKVTIDGSEIALIGDWHVSTHEYGVEVVHDDYDGPEAGRTWVSSDFADALGDIIEKELY